MGWRSDLRSLALFSAGIPAEFFAGIPAERGRDDTTQILDCRLMQEWRVSAGLPDGAPSANDGARDAQPNAIAALKAKKRADP